MRLVEGAVRDVCGLSRRGLSFHVRAVELRGRPATVLKVWAVLHFTASAASPYCCGEPECHLGLKGDAGREVDEHVRRAMGLRREFRVDFGDRIDVEYHDGVQFTY
jgi:hypothetical protein